MVVIELAAFLVAHVVMRLVVVVVIDNAHIAAEVLHYLAGDGGLAAAGASGYTYYYNIAHL